jgi:cytochrome c553
MVSSWRFASQVGEGVHAMDAPVSAIRSFRDTESRGCVAIAVEAILRGLCVVALRDACEHPPYAFQIADTDMMRPLPIAASLMLALLPLALAAQEPATATPTGNAAAGKQLTFTCQGCHGVTGYKNAYPSYHVPRIGGQSPQYLVNALSEYKQGKRKHPTMQAQAESFSDQDIADIAAFLSSLK